MNRREIFTAAMDHQELGHVLVDYGKHIGSFHRNAYSQLKEHLGIELEMETQILDRMAQNVVIDEEVCQRLNIDFRWLVPHWVNVRVLEIDGELGYVDMWQTPHKWTDVGQYYAIHTQPLGQENLLLDDLDAFGWPDPDDLAMFHGLREKAKAWHENSDYVIGADGIKVGILADRIPDPGL